ncbi:MAG: hypothetical protein HYV62_15985 [Candidatus Rokubacteria bacterium]|nr:hypothetical protein [Candidatus Rokubacteria bacterium]
MGKLYLVGDKEEIDRRRKLVDPSLLVEVWQDLYAPDIVWVGDDAVRRITYGQSRQRTPAGLFWMGAESKRALDSVGGELGFVLALGDQAVHVYYGPRLVDVESLPVEESLRARVLSAHGIAVAWVTYDRFGERNQYEPKLPTDPTFFLRRPRGRAAHLWRLFRTKRDAVTYVAEYFANDPEATEWAEQLAVESFDELVERFRQHG